MFFVFFFFVCFFFQAEDGIRDLVRSRGLGDVYKRQIVDRIKKGLPVVVQGDGSSLWTLTHADDFAIGLLGLLGNNRALGCLLYTSDAADERSSVDLGGRRIIKKKKRKLNKKNNNT